MKRYFKINESKLRYHLDGHAKKAVRDIILSLVFFSGVFGVLLASITRMQSHMGEAGQRFSTGLLNFVLFGWSLVIVAAGWNIWLEFHRSRKGRSPFGNA